MCPRADLVSAELTPRPGGQASRPRHRAREPRRAAGRYLAVRAMPLALAILWPKCGQPQADYRTPAQRPDLTTARSSPLPRKINLIWTASDVGELNLEAYLGGYTLDAGQLRFVACWAACSGPIRAAARTRS
jgi:hypothetical protein